MGAICCAQTNDTKPKKKEGGKTGGGGKITEKGQFDGPDRFHSIYY